MLSRIMGNENPKPVQVYCLMTKIQLYVSLCNHSLYEVWKLVFVTGLKKIIIKNKNKIYIYINH